MTFRERERVSSIRRNVNLPGMFENLRKVSEDKWSGCCPMHGGDNTQGFAVSRRNGEWTWRCFTGDCGFGDAIDLVMSRERCTMREAVEILDSGTVRDTMPASYGAHGVADYGASSAQPSIFLVCDACRDETLEVAGKTYGNGGSRPNFTTTPEQEALGARGWHVAPDLIACVGPKCLGTKPPVVNAA